MTDASSDSDDSNGRSHEWEVVSLSLSSHSLSASTSLDASTALGSGHGSVDVSDAALRSDHFVLPSAASPHPRPDSPSSEDEPFISESSVGDPTLVPSQGQEAVLREPSVEDSQHAGRKSAEQARGMSTCASQMQELPEMDWMEPMPPGIGHTVDYVQEEIGGASLIYALASESKGGVEPYFGQTGPLLGSCQSSPSAPAIVSSVAAFTSHTSSTLLGLEGELLRGQVVGSNESGGSSCLAEEEEESLAGLEREILGEDSGFEFPDSGAAVDRRKLELEDRQSPAPLLRDVSNEQSCDAWWKRSAALWYEQARQANTLWSIALAAAVMGLVIIGQRWQHERCQNQQLRLQLCSKDEKISHLICQVVKLKEALSGRRRVPVLQSSSAYSSFRHQF